MTKEIKRLTPCQSIHRFCLSCVGDSPSALQDCGDSQCSLYEYRLGKNSARRHIGGNPSLAALKKQKTPT